MRALPLLATLALAVGAGCVPARLDPVNGISLEAIGRALGASPSPSPGVREVDEFGRPVSPRPSATPADGCTQAAPAEPPVTGLASQGAYAGKALPAGWHAYGTEAEVTNAIRAVEGGATWACFQRFYADAVGVFRSKR